MDYCNSLLYGIPEYQTRKLQRVMSGSARLIYRAPKFCHITPLLAELHWLPVRFRIHYKILLITYNFATHSDVFDSQSFRHCCRSIARYFFHCLSFGRCIFETKLVLNIVGGHKNHLNRTVECGNARRNCRPLAAEYREHLVPGTSERRQFTWC